MIEQLPAAGTACLDSSALTDLFVYALGHELAAVRLSVQAVDHADGAVTRMLLTDLILMRLDELQTFPPGSQAPCGLAQKELARLFCPDPTHPRTRAAAQLEGHQKGSELLGAVIAFDRHAMHLLDRLGALLPGRRARGLAAGLRNSKARWIRLYSEVQESFLESERGWPQA